MHVVVADDDEASRDLVRIIVAQTDREIVCVASSDELLDELTKREAFGRFAEPWEVANVIVFLASDYSSYMTGEVVSVSSQRA